MLLSVPFHTVLGLTIIRQTLLGGDWYHELDLSWADPWPDQVTAGGILWPPATVSVTMLAFLVVPVGRRSSGNHAASTRNWTARGPAARRETAS